MMIKKIGFLVLLGLMIQACGKEKVIFDKIYERQGGSWRYGDTLDFNFAITDTTKLYNIVLTVRHGVDFPLQNIYTQIYTQFPSGQRLKQLMNIDLADNTGKWLGETSGKTATLAIPIQEKAYFNQVGNYKITLEQYSRSEALAGISQIGLSIVDLGEAKPAAATKKGQ